MRPVVLVLALATCLVAPTARADDEKPASSGGSVDPSLRGPGSLSDASPQRRHPMLSFFLGFPAGYFGYGGIPFSVGARYLQPILHDGFVPSLNDSLSVEAGVDLYALGASRFGAALAIPIEAMWALHFSTKFSGYLKLGAALEIRFLGDWCWANVCGGVLGAGIIAQLGLMYRITDAITLRAELGYPGLKLGIGLPL
ncbi:MAG: hypothetical protein JNJ54_05535 [Myxococcaceae bacterium]|nr:hypothetical protein [Myxococcaceae bacterium]